MERNAIGFDNLSNLAKKLQNVERTYIHSIRSESVESAQLAQARSAVEGVLQRYTNSRFQFGRVLRQYKQHFKAERGWVVAASAIADEIGRDPRTIYRIIDDYEQAAKLDSIVLEAIEKQGLDAAARKNALLVATLLEIPAPETQKEAAAAVKAASQAQMEKKRAAKKTVAKVSRTDDFEQFTQRILRQFTERYQSATSEKRDAEVRYILELLVNTLRADIHELRQYSRPSLVPEPAMKDAA
jgi:hypothetical protein